MFDVHDSFLLSLFRILIPIAKQIVHERTRKLEL
jgi:hypothetical protein